MHFIYNLLIKKLYIVLVLVQMKIQYIVVRVITYVFSEVVRSSTISRRSYFLGLSSKSSLLLSYRSRCFSSIFFLPQFNPFSNDSRALLYVASGFLYISYIIAQKFRIYRKYYSSLVGTLTRSKSREQQQRIMKSLFLFICFSIQRGYQRFSYPIDYRLNIELTRI